MYHLCSRYLGMHFSSWGEVASTLPFQVLMHTSSYRQVCDAIDLSACITHRT